MVVLFWPLKAPHSSVNETKELWLGAKDVSADVKASNGIIHVIYKVLLPE
jgi:uncharacterized surface protein with fasciclin (FAS1) repeats